jgi:hypothetical protein
LKRFKYLKEIGDLAIISCLSLKFMKYYISLVSFYDFSKAIVCLFI